MPSSDIKKSFIVVLGILLGVIGVLISAMTVISLAEASDRVPNMKGIKSAMIGFSVYPFPYPYKVGDYYTAKNSGLRTTIAVSDPAEYPALEIFWQGLIDAEERYQSGEGEVFNYNDETLPYDVPDHWRGTADITYKLNSMVSLKRSYLLHQNYTTPKTRESLANMRSFRRSATIDSLWGYETIDHIGVWLDRGGRIDQKRLVDDGFHKYGLLSLSDADLTGLAICLDRDFLRLSPSEITGASAAEEEMILRIKFGEIYIFYTITSSYLETLAYIDSYSSLR